MNRSSLILLVLLVLLGGCGATSPPVTYHSLLGLPSATPSGPSRLALLVGPVTVPDLLKTSSIATGTAEAGYRRSEFHHWAGELDRDIARALGEQLADRLGTDQVALYPSLQLEPTHRIVVDILTLEGDLGREARLTVRWSVLDGKSQAVRITRRHTFIASPAAGGHDAWVAAQRSNLARLADDIATAIRAVP